MNKLVLCDMEYISTDYVVNEYITCLIETVQRYSELLEKIKTDAIIDTQINNSLVALEHSINEINMRLVAIKLYTRNHAERFINAVDEIDSFVY